MSDNIIWERSILNHINVRFELRRTGCAKDDRVSILGRQLTVVCCPPESRSMTVDSVIESSLKGSVGSSYNLWLEVEG